MVKVFLKIVVQYDVYAQPTILSPKQLISLAHFRDCIYADISDRSR